MLHVGLGSMVKCPQKGQGRATGSGRMLPVRPRGGAFKRKRARDRAIRLAKSCFLKSFHKSG